MAIGNSFELRLLSAPASFTLPTALLVGSVPNNKVQLQRAKPNSELPGRSPPLQLEQALSGALGTRRTPAANVDALELLPGESISEFRVAARGTGEVLFDAYSTFAYTWLATRPAPRAGGAHDLDADAAARGGAEERVELLLGSGLTGAGYKGVPLQRYLLTQVALPFHWLYSRVILRAAAGQLQADGSSGKR